MRRAAAAATLVPSTCTIDEASTAPSAARRPALATAAGAGGGGRTAQGVARPDGQTTASTASSTEAATTSALCLLLRIGPPPRGMLGVEAPPHRPGLAEHSATDGCPAGATGEGSPLPAREIAAVRPLHLHPGLLRRTASIGTSLQTGHATGTCSRRRSANVRVRVTRAVRCYGARLPSGDGPPWPRP
jgi:hypothetical protein